MTARIGIAAIVCALMISAAWAQVSSPGPLGPSEPGPGAFYGVDPSEPSDIVLSQLTGDLFADLAHQNGALSADEQVPTPSRHRPSYRRPLGHVADLGRYRPQKAKPPVGTLTQSTPSNYWQMMSDTLFEAPSVYWKGQAASPAEAFLVTEPGPAGAKGDRDEGTASRRQEGNWLPSPPPPNWVLEPFSRLYWGAVLMFGIGTVTMLVVWLRRRLRDR